MIDSSRSTPVCSDLKKKDQTNKQAKNKTKQNKQTKKKEKKERVTGIHTDKASAEEILLVES